MRKARATIRETKPDAVYGSRLIAKLINRSMQDGKKSVVQAQVYEAFAEIEKETREDPIKVFQTALENIKPTMEVRPRRIGGAAYQVPMPVRGPRRESLAIRWLIFAANGRSNAQYKTYARKLAAEILDAYKNEGGAVQKKQNMERQAEANRAFSHFRW